MRPGKRLPAPAAALNSTCDAVALQRPSGRRWKTPRLLFSMLSTCLILATSWAQSPLVAELRTLATTYHEDPARLDQVWEGLERASATDGHVENLLALARVCFID